MNTISIDTDVLKRIIETYGHMNQMIVAMGEAGEFINAIRKTLIDEDVTNLIDELADIMIVTEQVRMMLDMDVEVQRMIDFKLKRQVERMGG